VQNFSLHRERADGPRPEAGRAENGDGVLGRGQRANSPPVKGLGIVVSSPKLKFGAT